MQTFAFVLSGIIISAVVFGLFLLVAKSQARKAVLLMEAEEENTYAGVKNIQA